MKEDYLERLRGGEPMTLRQQISLIARLSLPAIMAQVSSIIMQYIDASMVGQLGASASASIGLVSSSTWLFGGMCTAAVTGFTVQAAQEVGAGEYKTARNLVKQAFIFVVGLSLIILAIGVGVSGFLPRWLGGNEDICGNASWYFRIFVLSLPVVQVNNISSGMLQASGNMKTPSILHILMCGFDVIFNLLLIFPSRTVLGITLPGAGMGVAGAALGTALAQLVTALFMAYFLLIRSPALHMRRGEKLKISPAQLKTAVRISIPVAIEQFVMGGAQVMSTHIVAPLGTVSIAANSFSVTAESLCYMPGYGIGAAAATLIGQSIGAGRKDLTKRLGWLTTILGVSVMTVTGALMYIAAPWMIGILSPDAAVVALGTAMLRIEAFAEPLYAASIVASGVFRGAGDTLMSSVLNFCSMWIVRLPLAAFLAPRIGLRGVWIAMCIELCFRGIIFLIRLARGRWQNHNVRSEVIS